MHVDSGLFNRLLTFRDDLSGPFATLPKQVTGNRRAGLEQPPRTFEVVVGRLFNEARLQPQQFAGFPRVKDPPRMLDLSR